MYKIALLTYPFLQDYFARIIEPYKTRHQIDVITFERQHHLLSLIPSIVDQYDGLCVFSALAGKFVTQPDTDRKKPILYLDRHCVDYFKTFYMMLNENRDIDFSRVLIDTSMSNVDNPRSLDDLVKDIVFFEKNLITYSTELTLDDFLHMEEQIEQNALRLWNEGKFDIVVCRFASMASVMERENIPYVFVYPEVHRVTETLEKLINHIRLDKQTEGLPASIMIMTNGSGDRDFQEINHDSIRIQKALLEFSKNNASSFSIQFMPQGFEILTSHLSIQKITGNFSYCQLGYFLFSTLGTNVHISYGIGHDILSARQNAIEAAKATEDTGASCIISEDGSLYVLQVKANVPGEPGQVESDALLASRTGLSSITIQRIRSAIQFLGTRDLTNQDLADALQVTVANANRFLIALVNHELAEVVDMKKSLSRGRHSRIYRLHL